MYYIFVLYINCLLMRSLLFVVFVGFGLLQCVFEKKVVEVIDGIIVWDQVKVVFFNIWLDYVGDGVNNWYKCKEVVVIYIELENFYIVGM